MGTCAAWLVDRLVRPHLGGPLARCSRRPADARRRHRPEGPRGPSAHEFLLKTATLASATPTGFPQTRSRTLPAAAPATPASAGDMPSTRLIGPDPREPGA